MSTDHIDRAQRFLDNLQRMGLQLKAVEDQQKLFIARMLDLKGSGQTDSKEYCDLDAKCKSLQEIIDKYRPIYLERMEMVREVKGISKHKRTKTKQQ